MEISDFANSHPFVSMYLKYVENTESPRLMHIWSALSGISACMGRRCWYPMGTGEIWPNMYVILTGPPALRKSTAFSITAKLLKKYTSVRFAPDDTSGQRQGIIAAMVDDEENGDKDDDEKIIQALAKSTERAQSNPSPITLADLSDSVASLGNISLDTRDPHTLYIAASELNSVLGEGNSALLTFLIKMYDGDSYKYKLKSSTFELKEALLGMIGATTPSQLSLALPPEAVGQGFTSRAVFVFVDKKHARKIARPTLDLKLEPEIGEIYADVFHKFEGPFKEDAVAATELDALYERGIVIRDPRFVYYAERRHTHLQKLSMALAASRGEMVIRDIDVRFADQLLLYTEEFMPDALGEYGMSKTSVAKQRLLEFINGTTDPIPMTALYSMLSRDMTQLDFKQTVSELHNGKKISIITLPELGQCVMAVSDNAARKARKEISQITDLMTKKAN